MRAHLTQLASDGKPVVLLGDLNVAHLDADIWNHAAKHIPKSAGTTPEERRAFGELLEIGSRDKTRGAASKSKPREVLEVELLARQCIERARDGGKRASRASSLDENVESDEDVTDDEGVDAAGWRW